MQRRPILSTGRRTSCFGARYQRGSRRWRGPPPPPPPLGRPPPPPPPKPRPPPPPPWGCGGVRHFDERKTARAAGVAVGYEVDTVHLSVGLKERTDGRFSCCEIQIAYKDVFHIVVCLSIVRARLGRFGPRPGCCRTLKRLFQYSRTLPTGQAAPCAELSTLTRVGAPPLLVLYEEYRR